MTQSLALLERPHAEVLKEIITAKLKPGVDFSDLLLGVPEYGAGDNAQQPLYINSSAYDKPNWPYFGTAELSYHRVDLQAALGHLGLTFRVDSGVTSDWIVSQLKQILLLHFEVDDYVSETIQLDTPMLVYSLRATASSTRWYGSVNVLLRRR